MKKGLKKAVALLLTAVMSMGMAATAWAEEPSAEEPAAEEELMMLAADVGTELPVRINGVNFTSDKLEMECGEGTATLDASTDPYILTLDNATITSDKYAGRAIYADNVDLQIKLIGRNKIAATGTNGIGIYAPCAGIKIIGTEGATLELTSDDYDAIYTTSISGGEGLNGDVIIADVDSLILKGKYGTLGVAGALTIKNSMVEASATTDFDASNTVLGASDIVIDNSTVTVTGSAGYQTGIGSALGNITIRNGSEVTVTADRYGIEAKNISITDSTVNAECGNDGWYALYSAGDITMTGGKVATADNKGLVGIEAKEGKVIVDGTDLLAIGTLRGLKGAQGVTFDGVSVFVSENINGDNADTYDNVTSISSYKWVKTSMVMQEETPTIAIDFANDMLTGFADGTYLIDDKEVTPVDGKIPVDDYINATISIVKKGDGTTTIDSEAQELTIPARPAAPTDVSGGKGKISDVDDTMEYRRVGTDTWTPISGDSVTGLSKGEYEVRFVGTDSAFASEAVTVTVTKKGGSSSGGSSSGGSSSSKDEPTYTPTIEENEGGTASVSPKKPEKGDTVTVIPEVEEGYVPEKVIVRDENGDKIKVTEEKDGTFTFTQPEGEVTIEVIYAEEESAEQPDQPEEKPAEQPVFSDVKETDWYFDAVQTVLEKGLMSGAGEDVFLPQQNATRGMTAAILYRMSGESYPDEASIFPDVKEGTYYNPAVIWGTDRSVLRGYDDGLFRPDRTITREELALLIYNFAKYSGLDVSNIEGMAVYEFTDFAEISDWSMTAVRYCVNAGLLSGRDDGSFDPHGLATRAEVASVLQRFLEK